MAERLTDLGDRGLLAYVGSVCTKVPHFLGRRKGITALTTLNAAILVSMIVYVSLTKPGVLTKFSGDAQHYLWISRTLYRGWESYQTTDCKGNLYAFSHFPLYPVAVGLVAEVFFIDRLTAGYAVTILFSSLTLVVFHKLALLRGKGSVIYPLLLIATNHELTLGSIGISCTSMFLFLVFASYYFFEKDSYACSAASAGLAQATHFVTWTLFPAYLVLTFLKGKSRKAILWLSIPIALFLVFALFWLRSGDFWIFFRYNIGHAYHHYYPFATFYAFITSAAYSIWHKGLVSFSLAFVALGSYLLVRAKHYGPAVIGSFSLVAAASIGPAHGFLRYAVASTICLLGFTTLDLERHRPAWIVILLLSGFMYAYSLQSVLTWAYG